MRFQALAVDYDGTLAREGRVAGRTVEALERLAASGRRLILVTGRQLEDLARAFPRLTLFDRVVAENGALLHRPATGDIRMLAAAPSAALVAALRERGVAPLSVGRSILATVRPYETDAVELIGRAGLELDIAFNKDAVMVLPVGVNKASGLGCALRELGLTFRNVAAVGDGENDVALLVEAEFSAAVANAVSELRRVADYVTREENGAGVAELAEAIVQDDGAGRGLRSLRRRIPLGLLPDGEQLMVPAADANVLIIGAAGTGSALALSLVDDLIDRGYQCCIIASASGYGELSGRGVALGGPGHAPEVHEVIAAIEKPDLSVVVDVSGRPPAARTSFLQHLTAKLSTLRRGFGRPHWIVLDETGDRPSPRHEQDSAVMRREARGMIYVTSRVDSTASDFARGADVVAALGASARDALARLHAPAPGVGWSELGDPRGSDAALVWQPASCTPPRVVQLARRPPDPA